MAKASGYSLKPADVPIIMGMVARDDRSHDIAAWFGVNQGRIKETKDGKYGTPAAAASHLLPPKGPPGVKGRRLRASVAKASDILKKKGASGLAEAMAIMTEAQKQYDANEA
jgi:hypothetical protein